MRNRRGSNQHRTFNKGLKDGTWVSINLICIVMLPVLYFGNQAAQAKQSAKRIISPIAMTAYAEYEEPTDLKLDTPEKQEIAAYIRQVFGKDSDKAFKVLSCENNALNPNAVNTAGNTPAGSRDTGVFQINEYWQRVQYKFLLNYKVNVEIAYQIFKENGSTFERWTCGRKFGI